jgi:hypothetical protein
MQSHHNTTENELRKQRNQTPTMSLHTGGSEKWRLQLPQSCGQLGQRVAAQLNHMQVMQPQSLAAELGGYQLDIILYYTHIITIWRIPPSFIKNGLWIRGWHCWCSWAVQVPWASRLTTAVRNAAELVIGQVQFLARESNFDIAASKSRLSHQKNMWVIHVGTEWNKQIDRNT